MPVSLQGRGYFGFPLYLGKSCLVLILIECFTLNRYIEIPKLYFVLPTRCPVCFRLGGQ